MAVVTLTNARLGTPGGEHGGWLRVEGARIAGLGEGEPPTGGTTLDMAGRWVLPGLVDMHNHGGAGASFADPERARSAVRPHHLNGTTSVVASLVTAGPRALLRQVAALAELAEDGEVAGIHLEGPYLAVSRRGAHDPGELRDPDPAEFDRLLAASRGHLRMITVAPERPGALALVRAAAAQGVTVAVGHTEATYDQARAAFDAGARVATHLYNAMRPPHHREPGPVGAALDDERVVVELLNDGLHVHPAMGRLAFAAAGTDRVALVTDAMAAAGMGDGEYTLGELRVRVRDGRATLVEGGALAGSTIVLRDALRDAVRELGLPVTQAARAAATTPARALGLSGVGALAPGNHADLLVLDGDLAVAGVMRRGSWLRALA